MPHCTSAHRWPPTHRLTVTLPSHAVATNAVQRLHPPLLRNQSALLAQTTATVRVSLARHSASNGTLRLLRASETPLHHPRKQATNPDWHLVPIPCWVLQGLGSKETAQMSHPAWESNPGSLGCEPSALTSAPQVTRYKIMRRTPIY